MPRQGLNKEVIIAEAIRLIEESGFEQFSLREFAAKLNVKPASLYNHIDNIDEIKTGVGLRSIEMLNKAITTAMMDKTGDEAVAAAASGYRTFAKEHPQIYKTIINIPKSGVSVLTNKWPNSLRPLINTINTYCISEENKVHFLRCWRSAVHGFVSLEEAGFLKDPRVDAEESYEKMISALLTELHNMEENSDGTIR